MRTYHKETFILVLKSYMNYLLINRKKAAVAIIVAVAVIN